MAVVELRVLGFRQTGTGLPHCSSPALSPFVT